MTEVHPSAIVNPSAQLGERVVIGPFSIIEECVKVGNDSTIASHVVIRKNTTIGENNKIYQFSSIGEDPQHQGYKGEPTYVNIGDNNIIREYSTINRGTANGKGITTVGNDNFIMSYTHIAHDCTLGNNIIFANAASLAGHVEIGDYAILGGFTMVHQFCNIGQHCITGIGSVCLQDVPPYILAAGNPAKPYGVNIEGLNRRQFSKKTIQNLKAAYKTLYRKKLALQVAVDSIIGDNQDSHVLQFVDFVSNSKRGIIH